MTASTDQKAPSNGGFFSKRNLGIIAAVVAVVVLVVFALWWAFTRLGTTTITSYFDKTVGVYEGTEVRVLGVKVGTVTKVEGLGDQVQVDMRVDRGVDIPADARAVQLAPSVVADRYVQLAPAYTGGEKMESGAVIPRERTATPVEVDELYKSIDELSAALGPNGANQNGAVSDLVTTGAQNLAGNGEALNDSLTQLSGAVETLDSYRGDLFGTIQNLQTFVSALSANDQQVRAFNNQLSSLTSFLAGERENLGLALNQLSLTLGDVATFVRDNRDQLANDLDDLAPTTQLLADNRQSLADTLTLLPLAVANVANSYNAESGSLDARLILNELQDPKTLFCSLIDLQKLRPGDPQFEALGRQMQPIVDNCNTIVDQVVSGVKTPTLVLPFGLLSADNIQRNVEPGTVPGVESPRVDDLQLPGLNIPAEGE
ncbi:MCE family protein [Rhodococcus sp. BP-349]|nr:MULTISPECIES: MCE family protein [unclassified Rhodococcus (in: high G+C Gram-positive bacteria)]MBY6539750.1 MCE family protein [Rhodococcus sp. BP-363]MBY6543922.1 MCE family protein [Rhodococcus sp. BP-369]MBY6563152.1 MCE family protein [Rhodococcus sp. BP-370]MBY6577444.1 MCE family protein [Rhodococcus sp. BP-364]MBY6586745.1 MCE family protein [Rhodococcus sp. BP-358]